MLNGGASVRDLLLENIGGSDGVFSADPRQNQHPRQSRCWPNLAQREQRPTVNSPASSWCKGGGIDIISTQLAVSKLTALAHVRRSDGIRHTLLRRAADRE